MLPKSSRISQMFKVSTGMLNDGAHVPLAALRHALHSSSLFGSIELSDRIWQDIEAELDVVSLSSGELLVRRGDTSDSLYIVVSGRLRVVNDAAGEGEARLVELGRGQVVGEMGLITGDRRTASVVAIRDTLLARLSQAGFQRLLHRYPQTVMEHFAGSIIRRLWKQVTGEARPANTVATIALIPTNDVVLPHFARQLAQCLATLGPTLHLSSARCDELFDEQGIAQSSDRDAAHLRLLLWLSEQEAAYRYIVYEADTTPSTWTQRCIRQADHILLVGAAGSPELGAIERDLLRRHETARASKSLVLLHEPSTREPTGTRLWLDKRNVGMHYHVRWGNQADFARLARLITGQGVGVVLSGGGAKAMAHVGVLRALIEQGLAIDMLSGVSAGAAVAALFAAGYDPATVLDRCRRAANRVDYTFPFYALTSGRNWTKTLTKLFADIQIEDLWLNFHCISANLTRTELVVHESGSLLHATRASSSIPGVIPPVVHDGELLVDGGLFTNLPVGVMRSHPGIGSVIAVDVSPSKTIKAATPFGYHISGWKGLWRMINPTLPSQPIPSMMELLMQCMTMPNAQAANLTRKHIDFYLAPPTQTYRLIDWPKMEQITQAGYAYARAQLAEWQRTNAMPTAAVPDAQPMVSPAPPAEARRL